MSYFAKVLNGTVIQVIAAKSDFFNTFVDTSPGHWIETSYGTKGNIHYDPETNIPDGKVALRGNFASVGYSYDSVNDVFIAPQPFASWALNKSTWLWDAPIPYPTDGKAYLWVENEKNWVDADVLIPK